MPDYFDRLVAKGGPGEGQAGTVARVRPRLPGPFERIDTLGAALPLLDVESVAGNRPAEAVATVPPAPLPRPATAPRPTPSASPVRPAFHGERAVGSADFPVRRAPLLVAPPAGPVAGPAVEPMERAAAAVAAPAPAVAAPTRTAGPAQPVPPPTASARPAVAPSARRPTPVPAAAARRAEARRQQRPAERVVRVQIGRVEVRAAERTPAGPRRTPAARANPAVDLDKYLNREGT